MYSPRPPILSVLCVLGFLGCFFKIPFVITLSGQGAEPWYAVYITFSTICTIVCLAGLWLMRKWGVIGYTLLMAINQWLYLSFRKWDANALIFSAAVALVGWIYYRRME